MATLNGHPIRRTMQVRPEDELLTLPEAAPMLGVDSKTLWRNIRAGQIPKSAVRYTAGGHARLVAVHVREFVASGRWPS